MNLLSLFTRAVVAEPNEADAYKAGRDCALHGANEGNCHFQFFTSEALTEAWERGHADGKHDT
jgi:hypothetical protein